MATIPIPSIPNLPGQNLAITAADLLFATASFDSVQILNGYTQVLQYARPIKATVRRSSRLLDHPIETGQLITDYSIVLPTEVDFTVIVQAANYRNTYAEALQLFRTKQILSVQLKVGVGSNMVIAEVPHEETPDKYDAFMMTIKFREVLVVKSAPPFSPANPTQANTQALGQQQATPATPTSSGVYPSLEAAQSAPLTPGEQTVLGNYSSVPTMVSPTVYPSLEAAQSAPLTPAEQGFLSSQTVTSGNSISSVLR